MILIGESHDLIALVQRDYSGLGWHIVLDGANTEVNALEAMHYRRCWVQHTLFPSGAQGEDVGET